MLRSDLGALIDDTATKLYDVPLAGRGFRPLHARLLVLEEELRHQLGGSMRSGGNPNRASTAAMHLHVAHALLHREHQADDLLEEDTVALVNQAFHELLDAFLLLREDTA